MGPMVEWRSPALIAALLDATQPWGETVLDLNPENGALLDTVKHRDPAIHTFFVTPVGAVRGMLKARGHHQAEGLEYGLFASEPYDQLPRYHTIIQTLHPSVTFVPQYHLAVPAAYRWLTQGGRLATIIDELILRERSQVAVQFQFWLASHMTQSEQAPADTFSSYANLYPQDQRPTYRIVIIDRYD